nr:basic proline-rich protein-like [Equus asinus]
MTPVAPPPLQAAPHSAVLRSRPHAGRVRRYRPIITPRKNYPPASPPPAAGRSTASAPAPGPPPGNDRAFKRKVLVPERRHQEEETTSKHPDSPRAPAPHQERSPGSSAAPGERPRPALSQTPAPPRPAPRRATTPPPGDTEPPGAPGASASLVTARSAPRARTQDGAAQPGAAAKGRLRPGALRNRGPRGPPSSGNVPEVSGSTVRKAERAEGAGGRAPSGNRGLSGSSSRPGSRGS